MGVIRTQIDAVGCAVIVRIGIRRSTTTNEWSDFVRIVRATINAVWRAVSVTVQIGRAATVSANTVRRPATTNPRIVLPWITWAAVDAVRYTIAVAIDLRYSAAADRFRHSAATVSRFDLVGIIRATIDAIGRPIPITVSRAFRCSATAYAWVGLAWVSWAAVETIWRTIAVAVGIPRSDLQRDVHRMWQAIHAAAFQCVLLIGIAVQRHGDKA